MLRTLLAFILVLPSILQAENLSSNFNQLRHQMEGVRVARPAGFVAPVRVLPEPFIVPQLLPFTPALQEDEEEQEQKQEKGGDVEHAESLKQIQKALEFIEGNYPDAAPHRQLRDNAIQGMLKSLDPYSVLFTSTALKQFEDSMKGSYGGLGIVLDDKQAGKPISISLVYPTGPASKAGLQAEDEILQINGKDTAAMSQEEFIANGRGEVGTKVKILVRSKSAPRAPPKELEITRAKIETPLTRKEMLTPEVGYIHYTSFAFGSAAKIKASLEALKAQGAKAIILDLRNNGGGSMNDSIAIASMFLKKDNLVTVAKYKKQEERYMAAEDGSAADLKLAVLINGNSASASELLSGALQDNKRAVLVGSQSFGKGLIQRTFKDMPEKGYAVKLTVGKYYLPSGRSIQKDKTTGVGGLTPDLALQLTKEQEVQLAEQRFRRLVGEKVQNPLRDEALEKALDHLKGQFAEKK